LRRSFKALQSTTRETLVNAEDWNISELEVTKIQKLKRDEMDSEGDFGVLWKSNWKGYKDPVLLRYWDFARQGQRGISGSEFQAYAQMMSNVKHPYIHLFLGAYVSSDRPFIAHTDRHLKDSNLLSYLRSNPQTLTWHLSILRKTAEAFEYLHEDKKLTHGCIRGADILLKESDIKTEAAPLVSNIGGHWFSNSIPDYFLMNSTWLAPEVIQGDRNDREVFSRVNDVYSWAMMAYEVITNGQPPLRGYTREEILKLKQTGNCPLPGKPVFKSRSKTFDDLWKLFEKCWDGDEIERPSFNAIHRKLQSLQKLAQKENLE